MNFFIELNELIELIIFYLEVLVFKGIKMFFYIVIFIFSFVGNIMVIIIICRFKYMKCLLGNLFIVNLVFCDLLIFFISILFEMMLVENVNMWVFGLVLCKFFLVVVIFFVMFLVLILVVILLDWYRMLMYFFK